MLPSPYHSQHDPASPSPSSYWQLSSTQEPVFYSDHTLKNTAHTSCHQILESDKIANVIWARHLQFLKYHTETFHDHTILIFHRGKKKKRKDGAVNFHQIFVIGQYFLAANKIKKKRKKKLQISSSQSCMHPMGANFDEKMDINNTHWCHCSSPHAPA